MPIPGFTSTGSKRPDALFGPGETGDLPTRMIRSAGCRAWDTEGREYLDCIMALGAVALGYGHPVVNRAAIEAIAAGVVGPLAPEIEAHLAADLTAAIPWIQQVRFLKTGAEAVAAAVRLARAHTGREMVLGCGYHGWLDWCTQDDSAVPSGTRASLGILRFDDPDDVRHQVRTLGPRLAAIVVEPVIDRLPTADWLRTLREEADRAGSVLIFDEIKTGCRIAVGGAAEQYGIHPDLMVMGKAIANGFPLALVGGRGDIMAAAGRTWISSTLATEMPSLAAARATLAIMVQEGVPKRLHHAGGCLLDGLVRIAQLFPDTVRSARGVPEMCHLEYRDEAASFGVARGCARRGVLFKRSGYNFVSLAHQPADIDRVLGALEETLREMTGR
jgi:glutamate-1-semialdehyde 2,1-aminomutase